MRTTVTLDEKLVSELMRLSRYQNKNRGSGPGCGRADTQDKVENACPAVG